MISLFKRTIKALLRPLLRPLLSRTRLIIHTELIPLHAKIDAAKAEFAPLHAKIDATRAEFAPLHAKIDATRAEFALLHEKIDATRSEIVQMQGEAVIGREEAEKAKEYAKVGLFNQITLAMENNEELSLSLPDIDDDNFDRNKKYKCAKKEFFSIQLPSKGKLRFCRPSVPNKHSKRIFVSTLGKTGTHYIDLVLKELGFQQIPFFSVLNSCVSNIHNTHHRADLPFGIQEKMLLPGQYMMGHILGDVLTPLLERNEILLSIRDLRYVLVSLERMFLKWAQPQSDISSQFLIASLHDEKPMYHDFYMALDLAKSFLPLIGKAPFVRFEELIVDDYEKAWPSIKSLAEITECPPEEIFTVLRKNFCSTSTDTSTGMSTFTGCFSELDGIWTQEVEAEFVALGGDVINERLGYTRHINLA